MRAVCRYERENAPSGADRERFRGGIELEAVLDAEDGQCRPRRGHCDDVVIAEGRERPELEREVSEHVECEGGPDGVHDGFDLRIECQVGFELEHGKRAWDIGR